MALATDLALDPLFAEIVVLGSDRETTLKVALDVVTPCVSSMQNVEIGEPPPLGGGLTLKKYGPGSDEAELPFKANDTPLEPVVPLNDRVIVVSAEALWPVARNKANTPVKA